MLENGHSPMNEKFFCFGGKPERLKIVVAPTRHY
jgi:hypothetical protein